MGCIIHRFALLCVLIFGSCEAYWEIEDDFPKNAPSLPKYEIELRANKQLLAIQNMFGEMEKVMNSLITSYAEEVAQKRRHTDNVWAKIAEIVDKIPLVAYVSGRNELNNEVSWLMDDLITNDRSILSKLRYISELKADLRNLKEKQSAKIAYFEYRKQQALSNSEKGISREIRVEFRLSNFSVGLNVPLNTRILINDNEDFVDYRLHNPHSSRPFHMKVLKGKVFEEISNGTHLQGTVPPKARVELYQEHTDQDFDSFREVPKVFLECNSVKKILKLSTPDETHLYEVVDKLENDTFKEKIEVFKWDPKSATTSQIYEFEHTVDLNDPQEYVLTDFCQSSVTIKKSEKGQMISEKKLICNN